MVLQLVRYILTPLHFEVGLFANIFSGQLEEVFMFVTQLWLPVSIYELSIAWLPSMSLLQTINGAQDLKTHS